MIEITLNTNDLSLDLPEIEEPIELDGSTGELDLHGPQYLDVEITPNNWGLLDLDLLGFPYHGLSAYELAVQRGFNGTLDEWLASLKGEDGELGAAGQAAVIRAEEAAASAKGDATAASGFRADAYSYAGVAGEYARASNEAYTNAVAIRDETGQIAQAMTYIRQQSEALLTDTTEVARATIQERVMAETARSAAEIARDRAAQSQSSAEGSSASASDNALMAVEARNKADDAAEASLFSRDEAETFANEARTEAEAARTSEIAAKASRDQAAITATGVITQVDRAKGFADAAGASAEASRESKVAAEAAFGGANGAKNQAQGFASAAATSSQTAEAKATEAGQFASAANESATEANTSAGNAGTYANQSSQSSQAAQEAAQEAGTKAQTANASAQTAIEQASIATDKAAQAALSAEAAANAGNGLAATVQIHGEAIADLEAAYASARLRLKTQGGNGQPAILELESDTAGTSAIRLLAAQIMFGPNTIYETNRDTMTTRSGNTRYVRAQGAPFGVDALTFWHGMDSVPLGQENKSNAISWDDANGNGLYGGKVTSGPFDSGVYGGPFDIPKGNWTTVAEVQNLYFPSRVFVLAALSYEIYVSGSPEPNYDYSYIMRLIANDMNGSNEQEIPLTGLFGTGSNNQWVDLRAFSYREGTIDTNKGLKKLRFQIQPIGSSIAVAQVRNTRLRGAWTQAL
jgi:hypothetical protein